MKTAFKRWAYSFAGVNILFFILSFYVQKRLNIDIPYLRVMLGAVIISLFLTLSISIFKMKKGNEILKIALGLIALAPIIFVTRRIFGVMVFRYSFVLYIFASVCLLAYGVAIVVVAKRTKSAEIELNKLLSQKKKEEYEE